MTESKPKKETKRKGKSTKPKAQKETQRSEKPPKPKIEKAMPKVESPEVETTKVEVPRTEAPRAEAKEKVVYVGQKPVKNYVIACLTSFNAGLNPVIIKARGRAICKAVDTAELLRRAFLKDSKLQSIAIATEQVTREGNRKANVSTIEITMTKT